VQGWRVAERAAAVRPEHQGKAPRLAEAAALQVGRLGPRRRLLLCGYYGEHNLGDDALLESLLSQLPAGCEALVTAWDQDLVRQRFGTATTDRRSLGGVLRALAACDALVLGGGSLLQDATSFQSLLYYAALIVAARLQGKPVGLWGQGLGPLRRRRSRALVRQLLALTTASSWRDPDSATLAASWGVAGIEGSDPVWSLGPRSWRGPGGPIVLCWRPVAQLRGPAWKPYLEALARLAVASDRPVLWLPFHGHQDRDLLADLEAEGLLPASLRDRSQAVEAADPEEALDLFSSAGLVVAMRLHGLILAALAGAPTAALSYDPKVAAAATAIGCPCHGLDAAPPADLSSRWQECLDTPPDPAAILELHNRAECHRTVLDRLVQALPPAR
jgi:polysaccharide pyruvyl transferase CsaB